jgi:hypothetical protein
VQGSVKLFLRDLSSLALHFSHQTSGSRTYDKENWEKLLLAAGYLQKSGYSFPSVHISVWPLPSALCSSLNDTSHCCFPKWQQSSTQDWLLSAQCSQALSHHWRKFSYHGRYLSVSRQRIWQLFCVHQQQCLTAGC